MRTSRLSFRTIALGLLLLVGAVFSAACPGERSLGDDDDRPPIIISSGSLVVESELAFTDEGDKRFDQKATRGKSVKSFRAETGSCVTAGKVLTIMYGTNTITLDAKRNGNKDEANLQFPRSASVTSMNGGKKLEVATGEKIVSVTNETGTRCEMAQKITIHQVH